MVGKRSVSERPTNLDKSRTRTYSRCWWGCLDIFSLVCLFSLLSPSLGDGPTQTKILSQRAVKPKTTNQPNPVMSGMRTPVYSCYHVYSRVSDKNACRSTVELQWLEHLWDHDNMLETRVVRANEI